MKFKLCATRHISDLDQIMHERAGVKADVFRNLKEFDYIHPPLAAFNFGNERLRPTHFLGQLSLCNASLFSCTYDALE